MSVFIVFKVKVYKIDFFLFVDDLQQQTTECSDFSGPRLDRVESERILDPKHWVKMRERSKVEDDPTHSGKLHRNI